MASNNQAQANRIAMHHSTSVNSKGKTIKDLLPCDQADCGLVCGNSDTTSCASSSTPSLVAYTSLEEGRESPLEFSKNLRNCKFERRRCFGLWKTKTERWFMRVYFFISIIALIVLIGTIAYRLPEIETGRIACPRAGRTCMTTVVGNETIQMCTGAVSQARECFVYRQITCSEDDEPFNP